MAQNETVLSDKVRDYFVQNDGKVKRQDLFDHFRSQLDEGKFKNLFGDIVNSLAVLQSIEGERYFVLKKSRNGSTPVQYRRPLRGVNQRKDKGVSLPASMRNFRFSSTDDPPGDGRTRVNVPRVKQPAKSDSLPNNLKRNNSDTSILENTASENDSGVDTLSSMHSESSSIGSKSESIAKNPDADEISQNSNDTGIYGDDDQYEHDLPSHVLSGLQKSWMMSSMIGNKADLICLLEESPEIVLFKDFLMGYTALHWAAKQGNKEVLRILIHGGADVNAKSNGGYTALHLASMYGKIDIINILIDECSVDVHIRDNSGKEPKDVVDKTLTDEIKQKLKEPETVKVSQETEKKMSGAAPLSGKRKKFGKILSRKHHSVDGDTKFHVSGALGALLDHQHSPGLFMDQKRSSWLSVDKEVPSGGEDNSDDEAIKANVDDESQNVLVDGSDVLSMDIQGTDGIIVDQDSVNAKAEGEPGSLIDNLKPLGDLSGDNNTINTDDMNASLAAWEREHLE